MSEMIVFGILCFIAGINVGVFMSICAMNIEEKNSKRRQKNEN